MLWHITPNRALFDERLIEAIVPVRESPALFVDILLRVEPGNQRLDALLLRVGWSLGLCLLCVGGCSSEIACCRLDAGLSQTSINSLRKTFGDFFENFHRFSALLLTLQLSAIGIKLLRSGNLERLIPGGFRVIRAVQGFEDVRFGAEIIQPFLILNRGIGPAQCCIALDLSR